MTERHEPSAVIAGDEERRPKKNEPAQARLHAALSRATGLAAEMGRRLEEVFAAVPEQFRSPDSFVQPQVLERRPDRPPLTLAQTSALTGRHPELLRRWCAAGRIPARRVGSSWVIDRDNLHLIRAIETRARPERGHVNGRTPGSASR